MPSFWKENDENGSLDIFKTLNIKLSTLPPEEKGEIMNIVHENHISLHQQLEGYFPDLSDIDCEVVQNPFFQNFQVLPPEMQDKLIEVLNDSTAKDVMQELVPAKVLVQDGSKVSNCCQEECWKFAPVPSSYLCKQFFNHVHY